MSSARGKRPGRVVHAVPRSVRRRPAVTIAAVPETPETSVVALAETEPAAAPEATTRPWERLRRARLPRPRLALRWPARPERRPPPERHPGLYGVLGVPPTATAAEIHFAYRTQAASLARSRFARPKELRELNAAYEVLGNPARRRDYDDARHAAVSAPALPPGGGRPTSQVAATVHYPRLRHAHRDRRTQPAFTDLVGVAVVLVTAVVAAYVILSRVDVNLSPLNAMGGLLGLRGSGRPAVADVPLTAVTPTVVVPTPAPGETPPPQATPLPLAEQYQGSSLTLSEAQPLQGTTVTALVRLQRNGQPAADVPVYVTAAYRTTSERWPSSGQARTDARGTAAIPFNIGDATRGYEVKVVAHADVEGTDLTWESAFTPR